MNQMLLLLGMRTGLVSKREGTPEGERPESGATEAHLARINAMPGVLRPLAAGDVYVREMLALNSRVLHNGFVFPHEELGKVALLARAPGGIPVQCNHDMYGGVAALPVGTIFGGELVVEGDVLHVAMPFYALAGTVGDDLVRRIDGGVIREVSVQVGFDRLECSICSSDMADCAHWPLQSYNGRNCLGIVRGVDALYETSLVWAGMARDTSIRMAAAAQLGGAVDAMQLKKRNGPGPLFAPRSSVDASKGFGLVFGVK